MGRLKYKRVAITALVLWLSVFTVVYADNKINDDELRITNNLQVLESYIDKYYLFSKDPKAMEEGIYKGYIEGLGDIYSDYYSVEEFRKTTLELNNEFFGVGLILSEKGDGTKVIHEVMAGSELEKLGVKPGDVLYKIGDQLAKDIPISTLINDYILGKEGSKVNLSIKKPNDEIKELMVERKKNILESVSFEILNKNIGHINIWNFNDYTAAEFINAFETLEKQGMEKLIIDLRGNLGGTVDSAVKILAYILPEGEYLYHVDKNGVKTTYYAKDKKIVKEDTFNYKSYNKTLLGEDNHQINIPIVVLVDGQSASASEILAGTLKDYKYAKIVGETTFGKGVIQRLFALPDGSGIKLTIAYYYTPSGVNIEHKGIVPDLYVPSNYEELKKGIDKQLDAAINLLK